MVANQKILARGAEAVIIKKSNNVIKKRIEKGYRHPVLDEKLRKSRTKKETKLIEKAYNIIPAPKLSNINNSKNIRSITNSGQFEVTMQYIVGKRLSDHLDKLKNYQTICKQIGENIAILHDAGIIHGDLTTSNMILASEKKINRNKTPRSGLDVNIVNKNLRSDAKQRTISKKEKVYFIDFGLGFHSDRIEDKAVDLHLIKHALEAKHNTIHEKAFQKILEGYKHSKNYKATLTRLEKVEKRGRYKAQY